MQTYLLLCILCSTEFLSLGGRDSLDLLVLYKHIKRCADNDFQYIVFLMSKKIIVFIYPCCCWWLCDLLEELLLCRGDFGYEWPPAPGCWAVVVLLEAVVLLLLLDLAVGCRLLRAPCSSEGFLTAALLVAARFCGLVRGEPRLAPGALPLRAVAYILLLVLLRVLFVLECGEYEEGRPAYEAGKVPRVAMSYADGSSTACMLVLSYSFPLFWRANHSASSALLLLRGEASNCTEAERNHSSVLFPLDTRTHNVLFMCQLFTSGLMTRVSWP